MHSFDRPMLAKFGFADLDKRNPLHDLACQYLIQPVDFNTLERAGITPILLGEDFTVWYAEQRRTA